MKKVLVLSGGGSFGCFEMAVVSALILAGKGSWDLVTGVSAGSLNAAYLSTIDKDKEADNINIFKNLWKSVKNSDVFHLELFYNHLSMYNSDKYKAKLQNVYNTKKPVRPIMISTTSLNSSVSRIFKNEDIIKYGFTDILMCSSSVPLVFQPYPFLDDLFVDGGLTSNILLDEAVNYCIDNFPGEEVQIDVIVTTKKIDTKPINKNKFGFIQLIERLFGVIEQQVEYVEILKNIKPPPNIIIKIYEPKDKPKVSFLNFNKPDELWNYGFDLSNITVRDFDL
jgi:predicted patatin/cPLA2 family phospholipase